MKCSTALQNPGLRQTEMDDINNSFWGDDPLFNEHKHIFDGKSLWNIQKAYFHFISYWEFSLVFDVTDCSYHPEQYLREGNVFADIFHSVHGGEEGGRYPRGG